MPSERTDPVAPSCCRTVVDLIVRHIRIGGIDEEAGIAVLTALGYEPAEVVDLVHTAREAGE